MRVKSTILVLLMGVVIGLWSAFPVAAQGNPSPEDQLRAAVMTLWMEGPSAGIIEQLEKLAEQPAIAAQAQFHRGCALAMQGKSDEAQKVLVSLRAMHVHEELVDRLQAILAGPAKPAKKGLDAKDMPIREILRMAALSSGRAVIVDEEVSSKPITMVLPSVDMNQVVKVLSELAPIETQDFGDIMLIRPREKKVEEPMESNGKVTLDLKDVDVRDALRLIAKKSGLNMVFHRRVGGKVTIQLKDIEPKEALRIIARANDLHIEPDGDCLLVVRSADVTEVTGKTDHLVVPLKFLDPRDALTLLQHEKMPWAEAKGKSIVLKGDPEMVNRAREYLISQDQPQKPISIALGLWETLPGKTVDVKTFPTLSPEEKAKLARQISSPRIVTLPGRSAKIEIKSESKGKEANQPYSKLAFNLLPRELKDGLVQLDLEGDLEMVVDEGERALKSMRRISSSFVIKPGHAFAYDVQGGATPLIMEVSLTRPE